MVFLNSRIEEHIVARAFAKHGLRFKVELAFGHVGRQRDFPYIPVSEWIRCLDKAGQLDRLVGCKGDFSSSLRQYWDRFEKAHPSHQVFELAKAGLVSLHQAVPVYLHGDEGTTLKKDGALVISFQSPLGKGTSSSKMGDLEGGPHHLNFLGHAFETRFLIIAALKDRSHSIITISIHVCPPL